MTNRNRTTKAALKAMKPADRYERFFITLDGLMQKFGYSDGDCYENRIVHAAVTNLSEVVGRDLGAIKPPAPDRATKVLADMRRAAVAKRKAPEAPTPTWSALEQAMTIARAAAGDFAPEPVVEIDWTSEPRSEREAKIRARWIANQMSDEDLRALLPLKAMQIEMRTGSIGRDLAAAVKEARLLRALDEQQNEADEYADIADTLDEEERANGS